MKQENLVIAITKAMKNVVCQTAGVGSQNSASMLTVQRNFLLGR